MLSGFLSLVLTGQCLFRACFDGDLKWEEGKKIQLKSQSCSNKNKLKCNCYEKRIEKVFSIDISRKAILFLPEYHFQNKRLRKRPFTNNKYKFELQQKWKQIIKGRNINEFFISHHKCPINVRYYVNFHYNAFKGSGTCSNAHIREHLILKIEVSNFS